MSYCDCIRHVKWDIIQMRVNVFMQCVHVNMFTGVIYYKSEGEAAVCH